MQTRVIGIDVGGPKKGFHAVALEGTRVAARTHTADAEALAAWCAAQSASVVAVDAPCRWRRPAPALARASERALAAARIACYYAPTEERARTHAFYQWMLPGAALYAALRPRFPLHVGGEVAGPVAIETFPQAVACALAGKLVSAKEKRVVRRDLLLCAGLTLNDDETMDEIDARLCALAAASFARGEARAYGDAADGYIFVPGAPLANR